MLSISQTTYKDHQCKGSFLIPFLLLLVYLGGFTAKNSFGDMIVVLLFGALGWFMIQFDWQRPPLLLGLVLGGMAERNLWISTRAYGPAWLTRPGVLAIAVLPLFALFWVFLFAYVLRDSWFNIRPQAQRAALFPLTIGIPSLALALLVFGQELSKFAGRRAPQSPSRQTEYATGLDVARSRTLAILAWTIGFFFAIWILGFVVAVPVASFVYLKLGAKESWLTSVTFAVMGWLFFYGLFDYTVHLPFPQGLALSWVRF